jgi:egghead protein (zeste-white 4 protein)
LIIFIVALGSLYAIQGHFWPEEGVRPGSLLGFILSLGVYAWLAPMLAALTGFVGLLLYRAPYRGNVHDADRIGNLVVFRIVSRGQNRDALQETVRAIEAQMGRCPLYPYRIETVTDMPVRLQSTRLIQLVVPEDYQTEHGAKYKARALHYALLNSSIPEDAWIMHLDEESQPTETVLWGIRDAIREEEASGKLRIGQGAILYSKSWPEHPFLTLADMMRTGDDYGRFAFQHFVIGKTIFGMHGSFILVRNDVAKGVGFDLGPEGSITEDAWWAILQMQRGMESRWIDGYVLEQSTEKLIDFVKQRKRWYVGLVYTWTQAPAHFKWRWPLGVAILGWSLGWIGVLFTYINIFLGYYIPDALQLIGNSIFAHYIAIYVLGYLVNLRDYGPVGLVKSWSYGLALVVCLPIFALMESSGVLWGILKPDKGFHVVQKSGHNTEAKPPIRKVV